MNRVKRFEEEEYQQEEVVIIIEVDEKQHCRPRLAYLERVPRGQKWAGKAMVPSGYVLRILCK